MILNRPCPYEIELDDEAIYWHEAYSPESTCASLLPPEERPSYPHGMAPNGPWMRVAKDGSGLQEVVAAQDLGAIALDGTHIYWSNWQSGEIRRCAKHGCTTPEVVATPGTGSMALIVDGTAVYWLHEAGGHENGVLSLMRCPLTGCEEPTMLATGSYSWTGSTPVRSAHALAQDSEYVYWASNFATETGGGAVWRVHK